MTVQDAVEAILKDVSLDFTDAKEPAEKTCISFWVPVGYKEKFEIIQAKSNKKFGKVFQEVLKTSIDRVNLEEKSA